MPRLWIFSDLHQEWPENAWDPTAHAPPDGFDVAVVPGDIHTPLTSAIDWLADRLPGVPVVFVPGNHEFWWDRGEDRYTLADMAERGRELAARRGVTLLMDDTVEIAGARFVGSTLWTDFRHGSDSNYGGKAGVLASWLGTGNSVTVNTSEYGVASVDTLINSVWGGGGAHTDGTITFMDSSGDSYTVTLTNGVNIRDYNGAGSSLPSGIAANYNISGASGIDEQKFVLPTAFDTSTLTSITLTSANAYGNGNGEPYMAGMDLVLGAGDGIAPTPELSTSLMMTFGILGLGFMAWRRRETEA